MDSINYVFVYEVKDRQQNQYHLKYPFKINNLMIMIKLLAFKLFIIFFFLILKTIQIEICPKYTNLISKEIKLAGGEDKDSAEGIKMSIKEQNETKPQQTEKNKTE